MRLKKRSLIQLLITSFIVLNFLTYGLYINDFIDFKFLSIGDLNPYGGWSALKSSFTEVAYRFRGITKSIALTISIVVTATLFGRIFCGYICPIGAMQDFFKSLGNRFGIKEKKLPRSKFFVPEVIKYFILILILILSIFGLGQYISKLSVWLAFANIFVGINLQIGTFLLVLIIIVSLIYKRVFCRCLCPLGAIQGLLYAIGPLKIKKEKTCNGCSNCFLSCPVDIIPSEATYISPECINCLSCTEKTCLRDSSGYFVSFAGKKLKNSTYLAMGIGLMLFTYFCLPAIPLHEEYSGAMDLKGIKDGSYKGTGTGFGGNIKVIVTIKTQKINKIDIISHNETPGYYEEVYKNMTLQIIETQSLNIDGVSGATVTSRAFINGVKSGLSQALDKE